MPRPLRDFQPGHTYLISQQGNKQIPVYIDDKDRDQAARLLHLHALRYHVEIVAFGFGEFEGRWLLRPSTTDGISNLMRDMQSGYSRHLNHKYEHRPCCGKRRLAGAPPCHSSRSNSIRNSSNWTPRFKMTEIADDCLGTAIDLVKSVEIEQPRPVPRKEQGKCPKPTPRRPSEYLQIMRDALCGSLPFAIVMARSIPLRT